MAFQKVCTLDDLWEGDMMSVELDGVEVLLVWPEGGGIAAYQGMCPHQDIPLDEGKFNGKVIMCRAHQWTFDATTGEGINPGDCKLARYPLKVEGDDVLVDVEDVVPLFSHS